MMMIANAREKLFVVPWNLKFNKLSGINFVAANIFSSLLLPNLFSKLVCLVDNVLRMSSELVHVFSSISFSDFADSAA